MNHKRTWLLLVTGGALGVALLVAGCSSARKEKWLRVFFDGVPSDRPAASAQASPAPAPALVATGAVERGASLLNMPTVEPVIFRHKPFLDETCSDCHESKFSQGLKGKPKDVCFSCHKDFLKEIKYTHAPADSGECVACHHPHQSVHKGLLVRIGKALCFECHDDFLEKAKVKHAPAESGECLACHTAHASAHKGLLVRTGKAMCFECHDDFLEPAKFRHTAVDDCSSCHSAHHSEEKGLLIKSAQQICLECHELKDLSTVKGHEANAPPACLQCHDPHIGSDKFLLRASAKAAAAKAGASVTHETRAAP